MTPVQIYKFYLAVKLHFTSEKYDVFRYRGAVGHVTEAGFYKKRGFGRFVQLANRIKEPQEAVQYFVACFAYDVDIFNDQECSDALVKWRRNKEMMTQLIIDDIDALELPDVLRDSPCLLQKMLSGGQCNIETAVALNRKYKFSSEWKNNFVYSHLGLKIEKLDPFVKFNESRVFEKISEKDHEQQETTDLS